MSHIVAYNYNTFNTIQRLSYTKLSSQHDTGIVSPCYYNSLLSFQLSTLIHNYFQLTEPAVNKVKLLLQ